MAGSTYAFSSKEEGSGAVLRGPAMVKGMFGGGGRVACEQSSSEGTQIGCLRTLLIARTKLKLFNAPCIRGGASSEVLRRLECAVAGALIDYLITSIGIGPFHLRSQLPSCCRAATLQQTAAWSRTSNTTLLHHSAASMSGTSTFDTFLRRHER